jgi:flavin reductase (DIM6/NTAB) family NADH-FMN oxidoreductase RutF
MPYSKECRLPTGLESQDRVKEKRIIVKIEIGNMKPENFKDRWPGEFNIFSHFEMALGIPHALFMITTMKENGKSNACFQSWSSFTGDSGGYFVITNLCKHTHTYKNILRTKEFCVNFLSAEYYDACYKTIFNNAEDVDEIDVGGFTSEPAHLIKVPRIQEAFLSLECSFESGIDLSGKGISSLLIGKVILGAIDENFINGSANKYGPDGFMFYLNELYNFSSGNQGERKVASLRVMRKG